MKIALAQLNYHIGNFENNILKAHQAIEKAKEQNADLIVFAELAVSGYPPRDFLEFNHFIEKCNDAVEDIALKCEGIAAIVGAPVINWEGKGKPLYNSAVFCENGTIKTIRNKTLLPNYDIFDEYRYFEPNHQFDCIEFKGKKIALTVCEDLWNLDHNPLYKLNPMDELIQQKPDLMINIAASPFHFEQARIRKDVLTRNAKKYKLPLFYVNHVGAQTELLFDGGSLAINDKGGIVHEMKYFDEDIKVFDLDDVNASKTEAINHIAPAQVIKEEKIELIHDAIVMGIRNYFNKLGFKKAILGLSGGIDSAVTAVLAARALGGENVYCVLMPSQYSTEHSVSEAVELAENLKCKHDIIPIEDAYHSMEETLSKQFEGTEFGLTEENLQARLRGVILMGLSNKFGHILLNTSNKSEAAVGYGTLYGDMNGGLSVIGDVYKSDVFRLAHYINKDKEVIPHNTIVKPPSAELRPDQKDSDSLPDYSILDEILYQYIELRMGPVELQMRGYDEELIKRIMKLVNTNEYKRYQTPPILRVSSKAFGFGRRMPIVAKYLS
ncbi:MAG: NAD+ synthase [Hyphomicrobiales bacterium]